MWKAFKEWFFGPDKPNPRWENPMRPTKKTLPTLPKEKRQDKRHSSSDFGKSIDSFE